MNVFSLFENAVAAWGDRTAVRGGARRQSYSELNAAAAAFAGHLTSLGLTPGDRVAVFMQNGLLYPAVLMGAFRGGYVPMPINAKLHPREVGYIVENATAKAIVVDSDALKGVAAAAPSLQPGDFIVAGTSSAPGNLEALLRPETANAGPPAECNPNDPAWLFYTSGTTGRPKGATLSHRNLIAMAVNCLADICAFGPNDRLLHAAPLSHGSGMYLIPALSRGAENIIDAGGAFDPDRILRFVARERVTVLPFLAPTMIVRLLEADPTIRAPELRAIVYGGSDPSRTPASRTAAVRTRLDATLRPGRVTDDHRLSSDLGPRGRGRRNIAIRRIGSLGCRSPDSRRCGVRPAAR
jgi:long-chain acyl-CoA synthetase